MQKYAKFFILFIIILFITNINYCYAVNLNLTENTNDTNTLTNTLDDEDLDDTETDEFSTTSNTSSFSDSAYESSVSITDLNNLPESGLGLTNILNIFLIVVGILLILLAIAILIRLKH